MVNQAWRWVTERGLRIATGVHTLAHYHALIRAALTEVEAIIPADGSLLVVLHPGASPSSRLLALLTANLPVEIAPSGQVHELLADYGGAAGRIWPRWPKPQG